MPDSGLELLRVASWEVLGALVDSFFWSARPGAYVFGSAKLPAMQILADKGLMELEKENSQWVGRLTEMGRQALADDMNPTERWNHKWDGKWQMLIFDLPKRCGKERQRLNNWLKEEGFGCLQGSLWIRPRPLPDEVIDYEQFGVEPDSIVAVFAELHGQPDHRGVVKKAWNFGKINQRYESYVKQIKEWKKEGRRKNLAQVIRGWKIASREDPFLPIEIEPTGYLGRKAWKARFDYIFAK